MPSMSPAARVSGIPLGMVNIDGAWRLNTSLRPSPSEASLPSPGLRSSASEASPPTRRAIDPSPSALAPKRLYADGRQFVTPGNERTLMQENLRIADSRAATLAQSRQRELHEDLVRSRDGAWDMRWGFPGKLTQEDSPSRRKADPTANARPTLAGYHGMGQRAAAG